MKAHTRWAHTGERAAQLWQRREKNEGFAAEPATYVALSALSAVVMRPKDDIWEAHLWSIAGTQALAKADKEDALEYQGCAECLKKGCALPPRA